MNYDDRKAELKEDFIKTESLKDDEEDILSDISNESGKIALFLIKKNLNQK